MSEQTTQGAQPATENTQGAQTAPAVNPAPAAPAQPNAQGAQPGGEQQPNAEGQAAEPYRSFASQQELDAFVVKAKQQAQRAGVRALAKEFGFEDADELREALAVIRRQDKGNGEGTTTAQPDTPEQPAQPDAAQVLGLKLQVAAAKNLPVALVARLQGATKEELEADADQLLGLVGSHQGPPQPGIPPAPQNGQPVTFTRQQLSDPAFVRANRTAIEQAHREGRIVRS